jgi:hypothetical protein
MSDATCPACAGDNLTDYPVCDTCATVAHFTHRATCLHCERKHAAAGRTEANARLIAAATDMLELLAEIRDQHLIPRCGRDDCNDCDDKIFAARIDALIEKIEGGEG